MRLWYLSYRRTAKAHLRCSHTWSMEVDEASDLTSDIRTAAHARLKNEFTEDEMYHNLMSWLKYTLFIDFCVTSFIWSDYFCTTTLRAPRGMIPRFSNFTELLSLVTRKLVFGVRGTRLDSNRPYQLQGLARVIKLNIKNLVILYYLGGDQQRPWSDCADAQAELSLCCSHMAKHVFSWRGSFKRSDLNQSTRAPLYR